MLGVLPPVPTCLCVGVATCLLPETTENALPSPLRRRLLPLRWKASPEEKQFPRLGEGESTTTGFVELQTGSMGQKWKGPVSPGQRTVRDGVADLSSENGIAAPRPLDWPGSLGKLTMLWPWTLSA